MRHRFHVPDMSCEHCQKAIEDVLRSVGVEHVTVDLIDHAVTVESEQPAEVLASAIRSAGYTPTQD